MAPLFFVRCTLPPPGCNRCTQVHRTLTPLQILHGVFKIRAEKPRHRSRDRRGSFGGDSEGSEPASPNFLPGAHPPVRMPDCCPKTVLTRRGGAGAHVLRGPEGRAGVVRESANGGAAYRRKQRFFAEGRGDGHSNALERRHRALSGFQIEETHSATDHL